MEVKKVFHEAIPLLNTDRIEKGKMSDTPFKKILEEASSQIRDGLTPPSPGSEVGPQGPLPPAIPPPFLPELEDPAGLRLQGVQSAEKTLGILEQYQKAIANPDLSLKSIYPLIESLSRELGGLHALSEKLPPSDPLQPILAGTGIVSAVEIEKFHRGEYV